MAEAIAISLSAKVAAVLARPAALGISSLAAIRSGIAAAARDLDLLRAFLRFAGFRRGADPLADACVAQFRDAAFELEDVADEYSFLSGRGFLRDCTNIKAWLALARRLRKARERLQELLAAKERYGILPAQTGGASTESSAAAVGRKLAEAAHFVEEAEIVGLAAQRRFLVDWLTEDTEPRRTLVAVCGMGGVGKTTLVTSVYKEAAASRHFDCAAWVAVSQGFTTNDLLRKIIKELHRNIPGSTPWNVDVMDYRTLVTTLRGRLGQKRYLAVLDDVWDADAWFELRKALLDDGTGSRIVITTRSLDVATLAAPTRRIMLEPLPKQESWSLFCNTVFREEADQKCPSHLKHWALKVLDKCCGLPLAIVSIGNLLALKEKTEYAWKNVHDSLVWDASSDHGIGQVSTILNLSIDDLPYCLQRCFLYCSIYPEDFPIKRKILIRKWIAEGLIDEKGQRTMEEVADDYLNQLVQRSLLQVARKNEFGRAKRCLIHDLIRELIVQRSRDEGFLLLTKSMTTVDSNNKIRHLALDICGSDHLSPSKMASLRSFHAYLSDLDVSLLYDFRLLTVLNLWLMEINKLPSAVFNLVNLRYLGIRSTLVDNLPDELGKLQNLQTLDAKWSMIQRLPSSITKLKRLRHLILFQRHEPRLFGPPFPGIAIRLPKGLQNLSCLQTLKYVKADDKMVKSLGSLEQMRSLELYDVDDSNIADLCSSISKMRCLLRLGIVSRDPNVTLDLESISPHALKLRKLGLTGKLIRGKLPSWLCSLTNLMQLYLCASEIREDSIALLSSLPRLLHLSLINAYSEKCLNFAAGCFPVLRTLRLQALPDLTRIEFEKESLVQLRELMLGQCTELTAGPQGIENLVQLQKLELVGMPSELVDKLQEGNVMGGIIKAFDTLPFLGFCDLVKKKKEYLLTCRDDSRYTVRGGDA